MMFKRLKRSDLLDVFQGSSGQAEKIGIEVEIGPVDPLSGRVLPYEGQRSVRALLAAFVRHDIGAPVYENDNLMAIRMDGGARITLEPSGAIEYCSSPASHLVELVETATPVLQQLAYVAETLGIALLPGGNLPFNNLSNAGWVPKPRNEVWKEHLAALGDAGSSGTSVMVLTISTQATFDYTSSSDLLRKLRTAVAVSPVATAMFANSPIEDGRESGSLSRRAEYWQKYDPARCGFVLPALTAGATVDDLVDWLVAIPMIARKTGSGYQRVNRPFQSVLDTGFQDGSWPTTEDWTEHLSQVFTDVRLRTTLEMRSTDGPPFQHIATVPAFWTGLIYHASSCDAAWQILRRYSIEQLQSALAQAAKYGLAGRCGENSLGDVAIELLQCVRSGLEARIASGVEDPGAIDFITPLENVVRSGRTFAQQCLDLWRGECEYSPARFVSAYRIR